MSLSLIFDFGRSLSVGRLSVWSVMTAMRAAVLIKCWQEFFRGRSSKAGIHFFFSIAICKSYLKSIIDSGSDLSHRRSACE